MNTSQTWSNLFRLSPNLDSIHPLAIDLPSPSLPTLFSLHEVWLITSAALWRISGLARQPVRVLSDIETGRLAYYGPISLFTVICQSSKVVTGHDRSGFSVDFSISAVQLANTYKLQTRTECAH
ncbi:hypothetical protein PM082_011522 [Marasmius tenuissimus]|nr:hypothetical protein PM082_011522 [Marasmius tenuissimus]